MFGCATDNIIMDKCFPYHALKRAFATEVSRAGLLQCMTNFILVSGLLTTATLPVIFTELPTGLHPCDSCSGQCTTKGALQECVVGLVGDPGRIVPWMRALCGLAFFFSVACISLAACCSFLIVQVRLDGGVFPATREDYAAVVKAMLTDGRDASASEASRASASATTRLSVVMCWFWPARGILLLTHLFAFTCASIAVFLAVVIYTPKESHTVVMAAVVVGMLVGITICPGLGMFAVAKWLLPEQGSPQVEHTSSRVINAAAHAELEGTPPSQPVAARAATDGTNAKVADRV